VDFQDNQGREKADGEPSDNPVPPLTRFPSLNWNLRTSLPTFLPQQDRLLNPKPSRRLCPSFCIYMLHNVVQLRLMRAALLVVEAMNQPKSGLQEKLHLR
jgi:hypothetical protein